MSKWIDQMMPDEYVASIYEINLRQLRQQGRKLILTDLDNTLVAWNDIHVPETLVNWLQEAQAIGFTVCILSNNQGNRVDQFSRQVGIDAISKAKKPKQQAFQSTLRKFGVQAAEAVMVGDQLLTDIQGGNRAGLYTILVSPIHPHEWWGTKLNRKIEWIILRQLYKRGLIPPTNI